MALLLVAAVAAGQPLPPEAERIVRECLKDNRCPGISVAAVNRQGILWSGGVGVADVTTGRPATATTRYQFASVTKVYTALLLAQLAAARRVSLDAPISRYLPQLKVRHRQAGAPGGTLRQLASHTAGFTRDMTGPKASGRGHAYTRKELLSWLRTDGLTALPGVQYKYSNFGYALLGCLLEQVAHKPYRDLARERILKPLRLEHSGFGEQSSAPDMAVPCFVREGRPEPYRDVLWDFGAQAGASELVSTVEDVALFLRAHMEGCGGRTVTSRVRSLLFTPVMQTGPLSAVGLGWHYQWDGGMPRWSHSGLVNEFRSLAVVRPDVGVGLVLAANGPAALDRAVVPLLTLLAPQADTAALDRLTGDYEGEKGLVAMVRRTPLAELTVEVRGAVRLIPWGTGTYMVMEGMNTGEWVRFEEQAGEMVMLWENRRLVRRR